MPQLNPGPWFMIFLVSWIVLFVFIMPKIKSLMFPNRPSSSKMASRHDNPWTWLWH